MKLLLSEDAKLTLQELENDNSKKGLLKQVRKSLGFMETNLRHPSLNTHKFDEITCALGQVFESYGIEQDSMCLSNFLGVWTRQRADLHFSHYATSVKKKRHFE